MRVWFRSAVISGLVFSLAGCMSSKPAPPLESADHMNLQVVDLTILSTNQILVGTNTLSMAAMTEYLTSHSEELDAAVLHGSAQGEALAEKNAEAFSRLMSLGIPVLVVGDGGAEQRQKTSNDKSIRTVQVDTDQMAAFQNLWQKKNTTKTTPAGPTVKTTLQYDTDTGNYELNRIELGVFGRSVWLVHEEPKDKSESGSVGIRLRKEF